MFKDKLSTLPMRASCKVNPRMIRLARALLRGPVTRENADVITGGSNSPDTVANLRSLGLGREHLVCTLYTITDRDGKESRPGLYWLTPEGHEMITKWLSSLAVVFANEAAE